MLAYERGGKGINAPNCTMVFACPIQSRSFGRYAEVYNAGTAGSAALRSVSLLPACQNSSKISCLLQQHHQASSTKTKAMNITQANPSTLTTLLGQENVRGVPPQRILPPAQASKLPRPRA
jgi:hypothetical protein